MTQHRNQDVDDAQQTLSPEGASNMLTEIDALTRQTRQWQPAPGAKAVFTLCFGTAIGAYVSAVPTRLQVMAFALVVVSGAVLIPWLNRPGVRTTMDPTIMQPRWWRANSYVIWCVLAPLLRLPLEGPFMVVLGVIAGLCAAVHLWFCLTWSTENQRA